MKTLVQESGFHTHANFHTHGICMEVFLINIPSTSIISPSDIPPMSHFSRKQMGDEWDIYGRRIGNISFITPT